MSGNGDIVEASFMSLNAASYIASTSTSVGKAQKSSTLSPSVGALRDLNAFLDYFLAIIIKETGSTNLQDLKSTLARVLDCALGYVALNEAQAELETYRDQENDAGRRSSYDKRSGSLSSDYFDVEEVWLQARVRCMIYSTVGEKEEGDFEVLPEETSVTPPAAIFLTAILEFLGEHILLTAARFARERLGAGNKGVLNQEDLDKGVRMDKVLGTIWQSYLAILPGRNQAMHRNSGTDTNSSNQAARVFTTLLFGSAATSPRLSSARSTQGLAPSSPQSGSFKQKPLPIISCAAQSYRGPENVFDVVESSDPRFLAPESESLETIPEVVGSRGKETNSTAGLASVAPLVPARGTKNDTARHSHPSETSGTIPDSFESSVFQWNSKRKSVQALAVGPGQSYSLESSTVPDPKVAYQYAPDLEPRSDANIVSSTNGTAGNAGCRLPNDQRDAQPPILNTAASTAGSGLRDVSLANVDPDSDYGTFLRSEAVRETPPAASAATATAAEAEARRQRIVAARNAALAKQNAQIITSKSVPSTPVEPLSPGLDLSSTADRLASDSPQRELYISPTMHLAAFLRNTGPRPNEDRPVETSPNAKSRRFPFKLPQAMSDRKTSQTVRLDPRDDTMIQPRGESLAEFLKETPSSVTARPSGVAQARLFEKAEIDREQTMTPEEDKLVAGPAYAQPNTVSNNQQGPNASHARGTEDASVPKSGKAALSRLQLGSPRSPVATRASILDADSEEEEDDDDSVDESIFGRPRRKPAVKETLAEFLRNSAPPLEPAQSSNNTINTGSTSNRSLSKIGRRLSSLSSLVGASPRKNGDDSAPMSPATTPSRPNHRPLMG